ncbi:aldehyde dehydrogenase domain-containing protein [Spinellus fusiger]|nr:aldehyde dehydrogenase domain-containing protein [Spinellus fusiger]KAI7866339.1 aldehyde dehydrogenase domain-containing protein [Spinellus fusiger]
MSTQAVIPKLSDPELFRQKAFINNEWVGSDDTFDVYDPATNQVIGSVPDLGVTETKEAIIHAANAFKTWSRTTAKVRHDLLKKWSDAITTHQQDIITLLIWENGKREHEAMFEVTHTAALIEWFAEESIRAYSQVIPSFASDQRSITIKQPVGVSGIITPWNFPTTMIAIKVSAALAAGCTVVIKPAAETPYSVLALCELAKRVGIPAGVINTVTTDKHVSEVGEELCTNRTVRNISFTGSTRVGKLLVEQSSSTMKRVSMELGGNAPFIVFDDADIDAAVQHLTFMKFLSMGQGCVCPNRVYLQKNIYDEFVRKFEENVRGFKLGSGFDKSSTHGPMINEKAAKKVKGLVDDALEKGATALVGGKHLGGSFFEPTILTGMTANMRIAKEEIFGPVAALFEFSTEEEVIELANDTNYGLAGYFYSRDIGRVWRVAEALETGVVGVNTVNIASTSMPFGGVKESGIGREGGTYGLDEYLEIKYISMAGI